MRTSARSLPEVADEIRARRPPAGVATRITAVDGPGGAGKTTLAAALAELLDAHVVQTDDFAGWDNPVDWRPALLEQVLEPLARGDAARYAPTRWGGPERAAVEVPAGGDVIVEGVAASRDAFRPFLAYAVWVETPRDLRLARGLARDGGAALADWERWMAEEDAYVARERPHERADVVWRGDA